MSKNGAPIASNSLSMSAGTNGGLLLADAWLQEKLQHFNRERIPERVVHAKGHGAKGVFKVTKDVSQYTCAKFLSEIGKETPVLARFSTVGGENGSADTARDPRGFAVKFYTEDGIWDMVGNNTPVFFLRDPIKFPDLVHSQKRDPRSHLAPHWRKWDYFANSPEAMHQVLILYSDRGTPVSARFMNGYASHTLSMINSDGKRVWVKWHFKTNQGIRNLSAQEATRLAGVNPDFSAHDLYHAIQEKEFPSWKVCIQVMSEEQAREAKTNPFDLTKVWSHQDFPLIEVGSLTLNENPLDYFEEIEQAAFAPSNIVPGLGLSPDKVLQGRLFAYKDAHLYRLGVNHHQIEVNRPKNKSPGGCPFSSYLRDGAMRMTNRTEEAGFTDYAPSSVGGGCPVAANPYLAAAFAFTGSDSSSHPTHKDWFPCDKEDYFAQPRELFAKVLSPAQQERLVENLAGSLGMDVPKPIQLAVLGQLRAVHDDLASGVAMRLGLSLQDVPAFEEVPNFLRDAHLASQGLPKVGRPETHVVLTNQPKAE